MKRYFPRVADSVLSRKLQSCGAVWVKGPKWCGKSTTAAQAAESIAYLQDRSSGAQQIALAKNAPGLFLEGPTPKLIDEWQMVPSIWDQVRFEVDARGLMGQFILTGSTMPLEGAEDVRAHSGIGRITPMVMRPMTLRESEDSEGGVSLGNLFSKQGPIAKTSTLTLQDYAYLTCRGGWPSVLGLNHEAALEQAYIFFDGLVEDDVQRLYKKTRNPERLRRFAKAYARAISTETSIAEIKRDIAANDRSALDEDTIISYINAFERLFVIENLKAWNPNLRSKTAVRSSDTRHFTDPSIAAAALGIGPADLLADLRTFGLMFESLCIRDLRTYAEALHGEVRHYRDATGLEADAIIRLRNGNWAAIEVKLASEESIEEGATHLLALASKTAEQRPTFLAVITATGAAYRREDGVYVIPLGCLEA